jgi:hypothetical protein
MDNNTGKNIYVALHDGYVAPTIKENQKDDWVEYGEDNQYYEWLIQRYVKSPTNNAVINNICKLVFGKGLHALDASKKPNEYAMMRSMIHPDCLKKAIQDLKMLGQCAFQTIKSKDGKIIAKAEHMPVHLLRAEKCNEEGEIEAYWYSDNWADVKNYAPTRIPKFGTSTENIEVLYIQQYSVGMKYYSYVDYQGALPYAVLEEEIANYLINEVQNGFSGTKIINFNNGIPAPEERERIKNDTLGTVSGSKGVRTIIAFNHTEATKTTIEDVSLNDAPSHYEYLADECMRKIMLGHNVTSPLLFGIATSTGFSSNADELKNSFILYYNMVIKPMQEMIIGGIEQILAYNGVTLKLFFETLKPLELTNPDGSPIPEEDKPQKKFSKQDEKDKEFNEIIKKLEQYGTKKRKNWIKIDDIPVTDLSADKEIDLELSMAQTKWNKDKTTRSKKPILERLRKAYLISTGQATPSEISEQDMIWDEFYFITRYKYEGTVTADTRPFCRAMLSADLLYRKEDIEAMSNEAVNPGWGPNGTSTYDLFLYKGGGNCKHLWRRQVFVGIDDEASTPLDPNSDRAHQISIYQAEKYGYRVRNPKGVSVPTYDLPNHGFLEK